MCIICGFIFGITAYMTNQRLKRHFRPFYDQNKVKLIVSAVGLSIPLIMRGTSDFFTKFEWYTNWQEQNKTTYEIMFFFISDIIPLGFQLTSLVFGYIRRKKDKKRVLEKTDEKIDFANEFVSESYNSESGRSPS